MNDKLLSYSLIGLSEAISKASSSLKGLTEKEVKKRLNKYGYNVLKKKRELNIIIHFLSYFINPMVCNYSLTTPIN